MWTLWKTAKSAVSHSAHIDPFLLGEEKKNEESSAQPNRPPNRINRTRDMTFGRIHPLAVHSFDDCNDDRSTGTQRAVPLRLGPQVQTLLPREGQRGSERRTEGGGGSG
jgi:hypothetical protein